MSKNRFTFNFVEKEIRKMSYGVLGTVSPKNRSQSTSVQYGVSPPDSKFSLYTASDKNYVKVKNIQNNPYISFVIPFPHHFFRFAPSSCVQFQGKAEIVPISTSEGIESYKSKFVLKMMLDKIGEEGMKEEDMVFIKIKPNKKIFCYGLGIGIMELGKHTASASYSVTIPAKR